MARVLVVDSKEADRARVAQELAHLGHEWDEEADGLEAFERLLAESYDLVVADMELPKLSGVDLIVKLRAHGVKTPVLILTAVTKASSIASLLKLDVGYLDKSCPPESLRQKIMLVLPPEAALGGALTSAALPVEEASGAMTTAAIRVLIFDVRASVQRLARTLIPPSVELDCCSTVDQTLAHGHVGSYPMILFDADASLLNLAGTVAQLHILQPSAVLVAMTILETSDDRQAITKSMEGLGFDDVLCKPIQPTELRLLIEQYCTTWDDLVTVREDVIRVSRLRRRGKDHDHYLNELSARTKAALRALCEACFDRVVLDLSRLDRFVPAELLALLGGLDQEAGTLGLTILPLVSDGMATNLAGLKESFRAGSIDGAPQKFRFFTSLAAAQASTD